MARRVVYKGGSSGEKHAAVVHDSESARRHAARPAPGLPKGPFASPDGAVDGVLRTWCPGYAQEGRHLRRAGDVLARFDGPSRGAHGPTMTASSSAPTRWTRASAGVVQRWRGRLSSRSRDAQAAAKAIDLWPHALPGSRAVLFTGHGNERRTSMRHRLPCSNPAAGSWKMLVRGRSAPVPADRPLSSTWPGGALWAVPFDLARREVYGGTAPASVVPTGCRSADGDRRIRCRARWHARVCRERRVDGKANAGVGGSPRSGRSNSDPCPPLCGRAIVYGMARRWRSKWKIRTGDIWVWPSCPQDVDAGHHRSCSGPVARRGCQMDIACSSRRSAAAGWA